MANPTLSVAQVSERIDVHPKTVLRWLHDDPQFPRVPAYRIGRRGKFDATEIEIWISARRIREEAE